jgi:protein-S-isoprenylcysteine O-methyltransferase Ste14
MIKARSRLRAALRSVAFLVLASGVVAGLLPWVLTRWRVRQPLPWWRGLQVLGWVLVVAGAAVLVRALISFVVDEIRTPASVAPRERPVITGLIRYLRYPTYLAIVATIVGQALVLGQPSLFVYAAVVWWVSPWRPSPWAPERGD